MDHEFEPNILIDKSTLVQPMRCFGRHALLARNKMEFVRNWFKYSYGVDTTRARCFAKQRIRNDTTNMVCVFCQSFRESSNVAMAPTKHRRPLGHSSRASSSLDSSSSSKGKSPKELEDFRNYLFKILREIYDDTGITRQAMHCLNILINHLFTILATEASHIMKSANRSTLTANDIQNAVRRILPGELQKHAVSEGTKAVAKFKSFYFHHE